MNTTPTAGPTVRTRLPREQRREQLLEVAGNVFAAKGYHAAVMDDIADGAGVSKPVLYQHFPSKLELYLALLENSADQVVRLITETMSTTDDNAERVRRAVAAFYSQVSDRQSFRLIFESDLTPDPRVRDRVWRLHTELAETIGRVIALDTRLPAPEARLLGVSLVGLAHVSARYWLNESAPISQDRAVELVSQLGWRGLRAFPRIRDDRAAD